MHHLVTVHHGLCLVLCKEFLMPTYHLVLDQCFIYISHTSYVLSTLYSVLSTLYSVLCSLFSVLCTLYYSVQEDTIYIVHIDFSLHSCYLKSKSMYVGARNCCVGVQHGHSRVLHCTDVQECCSFQLAGLSDFEKPLSLTVSNGAGYLHAALMRKAPAHVTQCPLRSIDLLLSATIKPIRAYGCTKSLS